MTILANTVHPGFGGSIEALWSELSGEGLVPWDNCVMDVVVFGVWAGRRCLGIEFNLFGAHLSSGGALFDWIDDYEELHGKEKVFVRFVDDWKAPVIESQDPQPDPAGGRRIGGRTKDGDGASTTAEYWGRGRGGFASGSQTGTAGMAGDAA